MSSNISDVFIYNNISAFNYGYPIASSIPPADLTSFLNKKNIQITHNLEWQVNNASEEMLRRKKMQSMTGKEAVNADPEFADIEKLDFRLKKTSPAIDAGWKKAPIGKAKYLGYIK